MDKNIRIGTRDSALAMWQANHIGSRISKFGLPYEIVPINTKGDDIQDKPLYELGITGIFTKSLDLALLNNEIDIAVHSMKDVPTLLPEGIVEFAVTERGTAYDILVYNGSKENFINKTKRTIATSSLRRKAQWLHRYKSDEIVGIRGNVITRMEKLNKQPWDAAIFAKVGLERIDVLPTNSFELDWMIPAPAQGALVVTGRTKDKELKEIVSQINHSNSVLAVKIEREFLRTLEGGCTAPIGAYAQVSEDKILFKGVVTSLDGNKQIQVEKTTDLSDSDHFGEQCADEILKGGADQILADIKKALED